MTCARSGSVASPEGCPLFVNARRIWCFWLLCRLGLVCEPAAVARNADPTGMAIGEIMFGVSVGTSTPVAASPSGSGGDSLCSGCWSSGPIVARAVPALELIL